MTRKSREHRKVIRAWDRFYNNLKNGIGYDKGLLFLQLRAMHFSRSFNKKYPRPIPKLTYQIGNDQYKDVPPNTYFASTKEEANHQII